MAAFWAPLIFVVLAEMGDKTQLLAMAFATRYKASTVLWGVFVATALNHMLAVAVGNYLTAFVPLVWIQIVAAASFILIPIHCIPREEWAGSAFCSIPWSCQIPWPGSSSDTVPRMPPQRRHP